MSDGFQTFDPASGLPSLRSKRCATLVRYWNALRGVRPFPGRDEIDPGAIKPVLPHIMLNSSELHPLSVGLAQIQAAASAGGGAQALFSTVITGSLVAIVPLVIAFLFLQRYWQSGLATGSVKG